MKNSNLKAVYRTARVIAVAVIVMFSMAACDLDPPGGGGFGAPTGLSATATGTSTISLSWNAVSGATHYFVYRGTSSSGNGSYAGSATTAAASISSLSQNTTYYFWVTAYNSNTGEESGYSSMASATTWSGSGTQSSPISLSNGSWENGSITSSASAQWYSFSVIQGNNYYVWWNDSYEGSGKTVDVRVTLWFNDEQQNVGGASSWDSGWNTPLSFNSSGTGTMKVRVMAFTSGNTGTFGICYTTTNTRPSIGSAPSTPTGLTATATGTSTISLSWTSVPGATGYYIYYNTSSSTSGRTKLSNPSTTNSSNITGCNSNTTYYFWVTAYNSNGVESGFSSYAYATTWSSSISYNDTISVGTSYYGGFMNTAVGTYQYLRVYLYSGTQYRVNWIDKDNASSLNPSYASNYTDIEVGLMRESTNGLVVDVLDRYTTNAFTYTPTYSGYYYIVIRKRAQPSLSWYDVRIQVWN